MILTKIRKLELHNTWTTSRNFSHCKENVFVKIEKDGITGYGEAAPNIRYGENTQMTEKMILRASEALLKQDLFKYSQVKEELDELIVGQTYPG